MMYYGPGMGSWGIALMIVGNVIFWGLLVVAAVAVVRRTGLGQGGSLLHRRGVTTECLGAAIRPR